MYEVGAESGRYYCLNVPLRDGIDDQSESPTLSCWAFTFTFPPNHRIQHLLLLQPDSIAQVQVHFRAHSLKTTTVDQSAIHFNYLVIKQTNKIKTIKRTKKDTVDNNITYMEVNAIEYE